MTIKFKKGDKAKYTETVVETVYKDIKVTVLEHKRAYGHDTYLVTDGNREWWARKLSK